jgi:hypothetical protein
MSENGTLQQHKPHPEPDAETQDFVRRATARIVNAAIGRHMDHAVRREHDRDLVEQRVWRAALLIAAVIAGLGALFVLQRFVHF